MHQLGRVTDKFDLYINFFKYRSSLRRMTRLRTAGKKQPHLERPDVCRHRKLDRRVDGHRREEKLFAGSLEFCANNERKKDFRHTNELNKQLLNFTEARTSFKGVFWSNFQLSVLEIIPTHQQVQAKIGAPLFFPVLFSL